jgi:C4-dicarboxylate-specific signal transduction histidine kinase
MLDARISKAVDELRLKDQMLILQDRLAVMGDMINNIAHQWRQPLNTMALLIQQLPLFHDSGKFSRELLDENTVKTMALIQHMSQTIDDFRNFFKSDKEADNFSIPQVIDHTLLLIGESFRELNIRIVVEKEAEPIIFGYANEYAQVILNLLINARDALVSSNADPAWVSLRVFTQGGKSIVTVTDNGGGIAEEIMPRLFDPYFTTKGPDKGTGIGLFMSKTIIEKNMDGRLTVRNTDSGAEFRIEI